MIDAASSESFLTVNTAASARVSDPVSPGLPGNWKREFHGCQPTCIGLYANLTRGEIVVQYPHSFETVDQMNKI